MTPYAFLFSGTVTIKPSRWKGNIVFTVTLRVIDEHREVCIVCMCGVTTFSVKVFFNNRFAVKRRREIETPAVR